MRNKILKALAEMPAVEFEFTIPSFEGVVGADTHNVEWMVDELLFEMEIEKRIKVRWSEFEWEEMKSMININSFQSRTEDNEITDLLTIIKDREIIKNLNI